MFLRYLEFFVIAVILLIFVTQVFIPMWRGTKVFPIFRSRQRALESKLTELREEAHAAELEHVVEEEQGRVTDIHEDGRRKTSS
jgi:hypothetical protein